MRKLLNTLFVTKENAYAALDGENVVVRHADEVIGRFPLHILRASICFPMQGHRLH